MKEHKFKMWDIEGKKMYQRAWPTWNGSIECFLDDVTYAEGNTECKMEYFSVSGPENRGILLQYTGLKDRNGVEIFEGDKIPIMGTIYVVKWYENDAAFRLHHPKKGGMGLAGINQLLEVIGNVWENPEMSRGKKERG